jgi:hypothetical protein
MKRLKHDVFVLILAAVLGAIMIIAAIVQIAEHLALLAVIAAVAAGAFYLGRRGRRQARPRQVQQQQQVRPEEPAAAAALPTATIPLADDRDELATPEPTTLQGGSDSRDKLLATPMSGCRPLRRSS